MSFKSRQTSLTNLSSVTDRMETFEPLALDRNDVFYQRPLPPKSYIHGYVLKVGAIIFVFCELISMAGKCSQGNPIVTGRVYI